MLICLDTFWTNPQFPVRITEINKSCESATTQGPNILVSVLQKPDKRNRRLTRNLHLGFCIFKASENCQTFLVLEYGYLLCVFVLIALFFLSENITGKFTMVGYVTYSL